MNQPFRVFATTGLFTAFLLLGACGPEDAGMDARIPAEAPYLRGVITAIDGAEVRIEENPAEATASAKAILRLTPETDILWRSGEHAEATDLRLGARVSAWTRGPVLESYPVQGTAGTLVIESTTMPGDPGKL
jgi:hypothetical protein